MGNAGRGSVDELAAPGGTPPAGAAGLSHHPIIGALGMPPVASGLTHEPNMDACAVPAEHAAPFIKAVETPADAMGAGAELEAEG